MHLVTFAELVVNETSTLLKVAFLCLVWPVRLGSARVLRTGSAQNGPAHGPEPPSFSAAVGQSAGMWRVVAEKSTRAPWTFHSNWPEQVLFRRPDRANGKRLQSQLAV